MNLDFLGDALDHWKGSLFESLQAKRVLREFAVDPMATDLPRWKPEDFSLYARLLRIEPCGILKHSIPLSVREAYFGEIRHSGDIFLDPDTGVATGKCSAKHISPAEIAKLLRTDRLVAVYQHVRAQRVADRVDAVCAAVQNKVPNVYWCSYESGTVAMIFLAFSQERVAEVRNHFVEWLGRHSEGRIRASWT